MEDRASLKIPETPAAKLERLKGWRTAGMPASERRRLEAMIKALEEA